MDSPKWLLAFVVSSLMACNVVGCGILSAGPVVDFRKDDQGKVILLDTTRRWADWRAVVDPQIAAEISGMSAPGFPSWNEKWVRQLEALAASQENAPKYIGHIIDKRREAGLPELEGFPMYKGLDDNPRAEPSMRLLPQLSGRATARTRGS